MHRDILDAAMKDIDGVFHFAALWLLHCWDYPRSAFEVNIAGTFNVLEAIIILQKWRIGKKDSKVWSKIDKKIPSNK